MITPAIKENQVHTALNSELPQELYDMRSYLLYSVNWDLQSSVIDKFNISVLRNVYKHTSPVDYITREQLWIVKTFIENLANTAK